MRNAKSAGRRLRRLYWLAFGPCVNLKRCIEALAKPKLQTVSTNGALYFADSAAVRVFMRNKGPFDRLNSQGVASLNDKP